MLTPSGSTNLGLPRSWFVFSGQVGLSMRSTSEFVGRSLEAFRDTKVGRKTVAERKTHQPVEGKPMKQKLTTKASQKAGLFCPPKKQAQTPLDPRRMFDEAQLLEKPLQKTFLLGVGR